MMRSTALPPQELLAALPWLDGLGNFGRDRAEIIKEVQARIQGVGAGARAHPWDRVTPFKMHYSIAFKHQFITGRPPLGEILHPPLKYLAKLTQKCIIVAFLDRYPGTRLEVSCWKRY